MCNALLYRIILQKIYIMLERKIKVFRSNGKVFLYDMAFFDSGKTKKRNPAVKPHNTLLLYLYIQGIYRTQNGHVYELNMKSFSWDLTDILYSDLDYLGNYEQISGEDAETLISERRKKISGT